MTREQCEQAICNFMEEIVKVYHEYNPDGNYLSLCYIEGSIQFNNEGWEDGADADTPIYFWKGNDEEDE